MSKLTVKIEEYNKMSLIARARLAVHDVNFDGETATVEARVLARDNQLKAMRYINDSAGLVIAGRLNRVYEALVRLAHDAEDIAEMRADTTFTILRDKIAKLNFGYADVYGELTKLIITEKGGE